MLDNYLLIMVTISDSVQNFIKLKKITKHENASNHGLRTQLFVF